MKNKFILVVLIGILMAAAMVIISCENSSCPGDGKCELDPNNEDDSMMASCYTSGTNKQDAKIDWDKYESCLGIKQNDEVKITEKIPCGC